MTEKPQVPSQYTLADPVQFAQNMAKVFEQAAGIARARAVVVTYPEAHSAERVVRIVRAARPDIPIVVRTSDDKDVAKLKAAGATEVIPEVLESSLLIAAETLVQAGIPMRNAIQHVRTARAERYASLRDFYRPEDR